MRAPVIAVLLLSIVHNAANAQARLPREGGLTKSLGQPDRWLWSLGVSTGFHRERDIIDGMGEARASVYHEFLNRALGVGGLQGELYNQSRNAKYAAGLRLRWFSQMSGIALGVDYSLTDDEFRPSIGYAHPIFRGGLFGDGTLARIDLVTGTRHFVTIGIEKPMFRRIPMGTTRPRNDVAHLPPPRVPVIETQISPALRDVLATARDAANTIQRLCVPWVDHKGGGGVPSDAAVLKRLIEIRGIASANGGRTVDSDAKRFHDAIDSAFVLAYAGDGTVKDASIVGRIAVRARQTLLSEVLFPYNRLLAQAKEKDSTHGYGEFARGSFLNWLHTVLRLPAERTTAVMSVFNAMLEMVEASRAATNRDWGTSRFVWLPLQLGLRVEQYDTQAELDEIVERSTGETFSDSNSVRYVLNEQFQYELSRTIHSAREYHVLWTHDFRGFNSQGEPDEQAYRHVLRSYMSAMTARVREYDSTGTFPTFIILHDEWFYEVNGGRLWMDLLEDPTRHRVRLESRFAVMEDSLRVAQDSLRAAIAASVLLTAHRAQYGEAWLRNLVKVHVNITNASDPSFWSWNVVSAFPFSDTWHRDHRKIVFYDVSEVSPLNGEAIFTGVGVGEHYANASWEDRSLLVRGPALLRLKTAAREALLKQGIDPNHIPTVLQLRTKPANYDNQLKSESQNIERRVRAVQLHNGTGLDEKQVNVAKAVLYTLMPAGSVIKIPDSIWNGTFWGSALIGASLRGVRVIVIAPSIENAPAPSFPSMIRARELLWRLLMASDILSKEIASSGGLLKVGMYNPTISVSDITGRLCALDQTFRLPWLQKLFAFPQPVYDNWRSMAVEAHCSSSKRPDAVMVKPDYESGDRALLHLKANFFASKEAWAVMARPEWKDLTSEFIQQRKEQVDANSHRLHAVYEEPTRLLRTGEALIQKWNNETTDAARERVVFYTVLGSQNQNDRSFVSDGEVALVLSNWPAIIPQLDMLTLIALSEWIETPAQLDALLPRRNSLFTRFSHWFKYAF